VNKPLPFTLTPGELKRVEDHLNSLDAKYRCYPSAAHLAKLLGEWPQIRDDIRTLFHRLAALEHRLDAADGVLTPDGLVLPNQKPQTQEDALLKHCCAPSPRVARETIPGSPPCDAETKTTPALAPGEVMEPPPPPIGVLLGITPYPPIRGGDPALLKPASNLCGRIVPNPVSATAEL